MDHHQRIALLKKIDLFRSFDTTELAGLAGSIEELELATGTVLCAEGELGSDMFILLEGTLQIVKGTRAITTVRPIDYIGEMALIEEKPRSATVIASSPARLLRITQSQFQGHLSSQPRSLVALMETLSQRIREDTRQLFREYEKANILIHDMRNAMSTFLLLDLMAGDPLTPEQSRYHALMRKSRQDVSAMMAEALANAKQMHFPKVSEQNSLSELLNAIPAALCCHPDLKDKPLTVKHLSQIPDFAFTRLDINRVVTNLVINAGQASPPQREIEITSSCEQDNAIVEVTDHGTGIPKAIQGKIFTPQFSTKPEGNGLGLASCQAILAQYGGTLSFTSQEGTGTTFRFTLPIPTQQ